MRKTFENLQLAQQFIPPLWVPVGANGLAEGRILPALLGTLGFENAYALMMPRRRAEAISMAPFETVLATCRAAIDRCLEIVRRTDGLDLGRWLMPTEADRDVWYNSVPSRVTVLQANAPAGAAPQPAAKPAKTQFEAGDRVNIGSMGINATVVQVLGVLGNGAQMLRVEVDKNAPKYPGTMQMYDTISSKITPLN